MVKYWETSAVVVELGLDGISSNEIYNNKDEILPR
jgi:hypothetical protein